MFSKDKAGDKFAAALAEYQADFEKRLRSAPSADAEEAKRRIESAQELVRQSGLGKALDTLLEHTRNWPAWSQRDDFRKWVGFPVEEVLAKEETRTEKYKQKKTIVVLFLYKGERYGMRFQDNGSTMLPDGENYHSGTLEFIANKEIVLGLDTSLGSDEFSEWRHFGVNALKVGPWTKALLEIGAHIRAYDANSRARRDEEYAINKAKNISI